MAGKKKVYVNVIDHRLINDGETVEDVTSIGLPDVAHPTTAIENVSGMVGNVDMPNTYRVNQMELTINHNNGVNCPKLSTPGKHVIEARVARQRYDVAQGEIAPEGVKYRFVCVHKETSKGSIETGNPLGSTSKYSVLRMEEVIGGETTMLIDVMSGDLRINGVDCTQSVESLLA